MLVIFFAIFLILFCEPLRIAGIALICLVISQKATKTNEFSLTDLKIPLINKHIFFITLIISLCVYLLFPVFMGERPIDIDHTAHFFRTWHFRYHMLPNWKLYGWHNHWYTGYPVNYDYPFGSNLSIALLHVFLGGLLTLDHVYGLFIFLMYALFGCSIYLLGSWAFKPLVGFIAAIFLLLDSGAHPWGGWNMVMHTGVWQSYLSQSFVMLSVIIADRLILYRSMTLFAGLSLLLGYAFIFHPVSLIAVSFAWTGLLLVYFAVSKIKNGLAATILLGASGTLGLCLAAVSIMPQAWGTPYTISIGDSWRTINQMANNWANLLPDFNPVLGMLGFFGLIGAIFSGRFRATVCAVIPFLFLLGASSDIHALVPSGMAWIERIEFSRFVSLLRPWIILLASFALVSMIDTFFFKQFLSTTNHLRYWLRLNANPLLIIVIFVISPFVVPFTDKLLEGFNKNAVYQSDREKDAEIQSVIAWLKTARHNEERFFRIAVTDGIHSDHEYLDFYLFTDIPVIKLRWTPANYFKFRPSAINPKIFKNANVRYLLSRHAVSVDYLKEVYRAGRLFIYEFNDWESERATVIGNNATVRVKEFSDERIVIDSDTSGSGSILVRVSNYPRWQASLNGSLIDIHTLSDGPDTGFISVPLREGRYVFEFKIGLMEKSAIAISLISLTFTLVLLSVGWYRHCKVNR